MARQLGVRATSTGHGALRRTYWLTAPSRREGVPSFRAASTIITASRVRAASTRTRPGCPPPPATIDERLRQAGYKFSLWGENIAVSSSAQAALKMWMGSKGHRDNILKEQFTEIGIGVTKSNKGKLFFTQTFAKPGKL